MLVVIFLLWCVIGAVVGYAIGVTKGRGSEGIGLGLLLGVIGWIIVALLPAVETTPPSVSAPQDERRPCPYCAELIKPEAVVCHFCGRDIEPVSPVSTPEVSVDSIRARYPAYFDQAQRALEALPDPPEDELVWLETVCFALRRGWNIQRAVAEATPQAY